MALAGVAGLAVAASALLDRPSRTAMVAMTVPGPKAAVWEELVDLEAYDEWNPVFRDASGGTEEGDELRLTLVVPGRASEELDARVLVSRPERKLWWQDRMVAPGIRDWEYEAILTPLETGRVLVVHQLRVEGLLALAESTGDLREALELLTEALSARLGEPGPLPATP